MSKILSRAGDSLADVYDVEGSIIGIGELLTRDVHLLHEMGSTIFSERLSALITSFASAAVAQNIQFNVGLAAFRETSRLLGIQVLTTFSTRIENLQVSITSPAGVNHSDIPIFYWSSGDSASTIRVMINNTIESLVLLVPPSPMLLPNLLVGLDSPRPASVITMRGLTNGFGAGTVTLTCLLHTAFPQLQGVSSRGLPIPGW